MLQWNPRIRVLLVVLALAAIALTSGWLSSDLFLEW
jgi:hypothetical protein